MGTYILLIMSDYFLHISPILLPLVWFHWGYRPNSCIHFVSRRSGFKCYSSIFQIPIIHYLFPPILDLLTFYLLLYQGCQTGVPPKGRLSSPLTSMISVLGKLVSLWFNLDLILFRKLELWFCSENPASS